jgi:hypothetical protein
MNPETHDGEFVTEGQALDAMQPLTLPARSQWPSSLFAFVCEIDPSDAFQDQSLCVLVSSQLIQIAKRD